ncbi:MAG: GDP-mannose 4,6-dehydratase [bacterium]|nr:GDP-mannose 4,6-dehydratase [bacterium]
MKKRALITGVTGQDGYYLSKLLNEKGYEIFGFTDDLGDENAIIRAVEKSRPDEVYNLGAISDLGSATKDPEHTMKINYEAPIKLLNESRKANPNVRFCQASSAEIFSRENPAPQGENAIYGPTNSYGVAKLKAQQEIKRQREEEAVFGCSAIFYNHESPKRGERFVTRKITLTLAKIKLGMVSQLELGNLSAKRDWGFAGDYMEAMWMILQQTKPDDYIISTGIAHSVRDFVTIAAQYLDMTIAWEGEGENEVAKNKSGEIVVKVRPEFYRPLEKHPVIGNNAKARRVLGWKPRTSFEDLVRLMAEKDLEYAKTLK